MDADIIVSVGARELREGQPLLQGRGPIFKKRPGVPIHNNDTDNDAYGLHKDTLFLEPQDDNDDENMDLHLVEYENEDDDNLNNIAIVNIHIEDDFFDDEVLAVPTHILDTIQQDAGEVIKPSLAQRVIFEEDRPICGEQKS